MCLIDSINNLSMLKYSMHISIKWQTQQIYSKTLISIVTEMIKIKQQDVYELEVGSKWQFSEF